MSLAHCPVRAASACSGSSPCRRRHVGTRGSVCGGRSAETGPLELDTIVGVGVSAAAGSESVKSKNSLRPGLVEREAPPPGRLALSEFAGFEKDSNDASVVRDGAGDCVSRRTVRAGKAGCSVLDDSVVSGIHVGHMRHNSRIHGSHSSSFACARVSSGSLLGACGVGSASAALRVCLLCALVLMLMLQRLYVEGWL